VSATGGDHLSAVLDAISKQVYEPASVVVVGGGDEARAVATTRDIEWAGDLRTLLDGIDRTVTHIWMVHDDARPRPDALKALVSEASRVDASVAGSKLLDADHPEVLESVGGATDVFGMAYTGLEDGEVDQEQYDVVRDVAFIPGASVLVRRDLLRGLGGPDALLPPLEAGIDFSQRARAAGGRVVVVPSSEVLHASSCGEGAPAWKGRAGRIRSALKVYSVLTLIWLIPVGAIVDLLDGAVRLLIGPRKSILDVFRSWVWNLIQLPSTIGARATMKRSRQVGDSELFRYQVRGSSVLRELGDDLTTTVRGETATEGASAISELMQRGRQVWQQPGVIIGLIGLALVALAGRGILFGRLPSTGYALHLPESALDTLRAYAGGWNPAELGNPRPLHPSVGGSALLQVVLLGRAALTEMVLTVGGALAAILGTSRLMRLLQIGTGGRFIAGLVAVGGPATLAMTEAGFWQGIPALGALPFAISAFLRPWPAGLAARVSRLGADAFPIAVLAIFAPLAALVPVIAVALWTALSAGRKWTALVRAGAATVLALPVLVPWIVFIDLDFLLEGGRAHFWTPPIWTVVAFGAAVVFSLFAGSWRTASIVGWGALLTGLGAALARTSEIGGGLEPSVAGLVTAAIGLAVVGGAAFDALHQLDSHRPARRAGAVPGVIAGLVLAGTFIFIVADGSLGLGEDRYSEPFEFTTARQAAHGPDRVLVIGGEDDLPGDSRLAGDVTYRVFQGPEPTLPEARLHPGLAGDRELASILIELGAAGSLRPGEQLASFGIRWVVFLEASPLEDAFAQKLDVKPLPLTNFEAVYENLAPSPVAGEVNGQPWRAAGNGFEGSPSAARVRLAVNADDGWQSEPAADGWALTVSAADGRTNYTPDGAKAAYAWLAGGLLLVLGLVAVLGRRWRP
jgi:hypothetical protein